MHTSLRLSVEHDVSFLSNFLSNLIAIIEAPPNCFYSFLNYLFRRLWWVRPNDVKVEMHASVLSSGDNGTLIWETWYASFVTLGADRRDLCWVITVVDLLLMYNSEEVGGSLGEIHFS